MQSFPGSELNMRKLKKGKEAVYVKTVQLTVVPNAVW